MDGNDEGELAGKVPLKLTENVVLVILTFDIATAAFAPTASDPSMIKVAARARTDFSVCFIFCLLLVSMLWCSVWRHFADHSQNDRRGLE